MEQRFKLYIGDTSNLRTSETFYNFIWLEPNCKILFSVTKQGNAANCHFTSNKAGLRKLEQAVNEWCIFCFNLFPWCKMIIGVIEKKSIRKLAEKCGFQHVISSNSKFVYIRRQ